MKQPEIALPVRSPFSVRHLNGKAFDVVWHAPQSCYCVLRKVGDHPTFKLNYRGVISGMNDLVLPLNYSGDFPDTFPNRKRRVQGSRSSRADPGAWPTGPLRPEFRAGHSVRRRCLEAV